MFKYITLEKVLTMSKKYEITNNIRTLRFFADEMSQQALAEKTGVSRQTINAVELGKYTPSLDLAYKIARAFDVNIEEVFEYELLDEKERK